MNKKALLICLLFGTSLCSAQLKYEKEIRIKTHEAPLNAVQFIDSIGFKNKVRWYKEIGYDNTSFEAKTKQGCKRISIEFSADGILEDAEVEINPSELPRTTYATISEFLKSNHGRYKFRKVQLQYTGDAKAIKAQFKNLAVSNTLTVNYEIIISTKINGSFVMLEYLFDKSGNYIQKSRILSKMTDNIEF